MENANVKSNKIISWLGHGFDRLRADFIPPEVIKNEYTVYMAKGETEGCHLGIYCENGAENLTLKTLSGDNGHIKCAIYHVMPILTVDEKIYTDPAVPYGGESFCLESKRTFALLIEFTSKEDTPAGNYKYELAITDSNGNTVSLNTVTVHVWNFSMPEEKIFQRTVNVGVTVNPGTANFEILLEHNLNTRFLPVYIMSDEADKYMSDPRITTFMIPRGASDETLIAIYEKLKSNPKWLKKAFFYPLDEPRTVDMVKELEKLHERLKTLCPEVKIFSPYYTNVQMDENTDQIEYMSSFMTAHCPKLGNWDDDQIYTEGQSEKFGSFEDRMKALKERGDTIWAYICNYPLAPYLNVKVDDEGIGSRVVFWQMYQRNIDGFLYWNSAYYERLPEKCPWNSVDTFGNGIYGDGILLYPGDKVGISGPVASIRLKIMRDGLDDIELFYMAERLFGREWIDERVNKATSSLTSVDVSSDGLANIRIEIGNEIEKALNRG